MRAIGVLGLVLAVSGLVAAGVMFARRRIRVRGLIFWMAIWLALAVVSLFPSIMYAVASWFSMVYGPYFMFAVSIMGLYVIAFLLYNALKRVERQVYHLAQSMALLEYRMEGGSRDAQHDRDNRCP